MYKFACRISIPHGKNKLVKRGIGQYAAKGLPTSNYDKTLEIN